MLGTNNDLIIGAFNIRRCAIAELKKRIVLHQ